MEAYLELEQKLAEWVGRKHIVACASGTAALHLALESLSLPPGSAVLLPEFTMVACAAAVRMARLTPVFVDCGDDLLMDLRKVPPATWHSSTLKAIMPVHIYGRRCAMGDVRDVAKAYNLRVVEDMAELHDFLPAPCSDAACWSFYQNKIVAGEEGGAIAFREQELAAKARRLRSQGFTSAHDFLHEAYGVNARLSNANAKLILESLGWVNENMERRRAIEATYNALIPQGWRMPERLSPWVYDLRIPGLQHWQQDIVVRNLRLKGIEARHGFKPMSMQYEFRDRRFKPARDFRNLNAFRLSAEVIYLPIMALGNEPEKNVAALFEAVRGVEIPIPA